MWAVITINCSILYNFSPWACCFRLMDGTIVLHNLPSDGHKMVSLFNGNWTVCSKSGSSVMPATHFHIFAHSSTQPDDQNI